MRIRKLDPSEVTFTITTEPDPDGPYGSFATGDDALDKKLADDIADRFNRGDTDAWCGVIVRVSWNGLVGEDSLWACSLDSKYTAAVCADEHGMHAEALARLNQALADLADKLAPLEVPDAV